VPTVGGDTLFASMTAAYEALSHGMKRLLHGLEAEHSSRHVFGKGCKDGTDLADRIGNAQAATQDAAHPVVIRHPHTGRPALYVNPGFTVGIRGWREDESRPLLEQLYQHATRPEFTCRFRWRAGSTAVWDNRVTWHYAVNDYPGQRRLMHRITIAGTPLS
jgi:taurine dioxygenase